MSNDSSFDKSIDFRSLRFRDYLRIRPEVIARLRKNRFVPFEVQPDFGEAYFAPIDPGILPPTFCHSWTIDLQNFSKFHLYPGKNKLDLNWASGDKVTVYVPQTGQVEHFVSENSLRNDLIQLQPLPATGSGGSQQYPSRIYVILRTSKERHVSAVAREFRRFHLEGLQTTENNPNMHAVLLGDTLNYDTSQAPNQEPWFRDGDGDSIYHPWLQGKNTDPLRLCPEPRPEEGWYLVGRFTGRPAVKGETKINFEPVWMLVYYNEQLSRLRLYLLPKLKNVTGLELFLRLLGRDPKNKAAYIRLEGAFFDDDPRPQRWGEAHLVIPGVTQERWVMVETNILFPMAKAIPTMKDTSYTPGDPALPPDDPAFPERKNWFVPLYDCEFEAQMGNVRLSVEITPFLQSTAVLDFIGRGVGTAIQQLKGSSIFPFTALKDSVETGIGAYKAANSIYEYIKGEYKKDNPNAALPGLLAIGAGAFSGAAAAVGAAITLVTALLKEDDPLRMALELQIRGSITGSIYTPLSKILYDCYLPGRFDAQQMHVTEGLPLSTPDLDQYLPRYDRTLGHLGYRYDPSQLKLPMIYFGPYKDVPGPGFNEGIISFTPEYWQWAMRCVWPAVSNPQFPYVEYENSSRPLWKLDSPSYPAHVDGFLPVIYNEFAEISPIDPAGAQSTQLPQPSTTPHQRTTYYIGNIAFAKHVSPMIGDTSFPPAQSESGPVGAWSIWVYRDGDWEAFDTPIETYIDGLPYVSIQKGDGYWLDAGPGRRLHPLRDFDHYKDVRTNDFGQMSIIQEDLEFVNAKPGVPDVDFYPEDLLAKHFRPYKPGQAWPIADVLFQWDTAYLYYGRTRQQPSGATPHRSNQRRLRSPIRLSIMRWDCDYDLENFAWTAPGGDSPSISLLENPWP